MSGTVQERPLQLYERMMAAGTAGAVAAVLVNPLDVVKTRIQSQATAKQRAPGEMFSRAGIETRNWVLANGMYTWPVRTPTEGPLYVQQRPPMGQYRGMLDGMLQIVRNEGVKVLYRGTDLNLLVGVPLICLYLPAYDMLSSYFASMGAGNFSPLLGGSLARTISVMAISPFELMKTRLQSAQSACKSSGSISYTSIWQSLNLHKQSSLTGKVRTLWTGCGATLMKDVPFASLYWSLLEPIKKRLSEQAQQQPYSTRSKVLAVNGAAGASAGGLAAIMTIPFDVVKTHTQTSSGKTMSVVEATRDIVRNRGWTALFAGWAPRGLRTAVAYTVLMTSYEEAKRICSSEESLSSQLLNTGAG